MAANGGTLGPFDLTSGNWKSYVEWAKLYFTANDITDTSKQRVVLLSSCGDAAYQRIRRSVSLCPDRRQFEGH